LPERPFIFAAIAQRIEQRLGAGIETLLQLGEGALRDLIDRELARIVAARHDEPDQRFRFRHLVGIDRRAGSDLPGRE
jgi:hypothetical protein